MTTYTDVYKRIRELEERGWTPERILEFCEFQDLLIADGFDDPDLSDDVDSLN